MFHMMNEERIGVGMGALQQGSAGYLYSLQYARERRQGRHPDQKDPDLAAGSADRARRRAPHAAGAEGLCRRRQLLGFLASLLVDRAHDPDETARRGARCCSSC
jgi:alkylation response protein AidB-like acyl-CoA dehydrogenase